MSFLTGADQPTTNTPNYTGVQIQTSISTLPVPVGWGVFLLAPNLVWYGDFTKKNAPDANGGKGGSASTSYDYTASLVFALCEGPVFDVPETYLTTQEWWVTSRHFTIINGTLSQAPWSYLQSAHPAQALAYPGTVLLCAANYDLGGTPSLPNHNSVVYGPLTYTAWWTPALPAPISYSSGARGADLALVIQDFLTNPQYGVWGFPSAAIDTATLLSTRVGLVATDASLQTYLAAIGMGYCPLVSSQEQAQSVLDRWLQIAYCAAVWSGTALKFIPYADQPISATYSNPYDGQTYSFNFVPNLTPVYDLDDRDFVGDASADPVIVTRTDPADAYNVLPLEVTTADGYYSNVPVVARDAGAIQRNGGVPRVGSTITAHEIVGTAMGGIMAQLLLQRQLYVRNTYQFKLSWEFCLLEPMDLVTLTDPWLGLSRAVVRITQIEEDDEGTLTVTAEEFPQGIATATLYQRGAASFVIPNAGTIADPVNPPIILEPTSLLVAEPQIWLAVSGGLGGAADPNWGGAAVWAALDPAATWQKIGTITGPSRTGNLTASLPAVGGWDTTSTLIVDLSESGGQLLPGTDADAQAGRTLCYVDGELLAYANAQLVTATIAAEAQTVPSAAPFQLLVAKGAQWSATTAVAYAAGGTLTATAPLTASAEAQTVPIAVPFQLEVTHQAGFIADHGVIYAAGGAPFVLVSGSPAVGQYTVNDGFYGFSQADQGVAVLIDYDYAAPGAGQYTVSAETPGVHYFNPADEGAGVLVSYSYANPFHYALSRLQRGMYGTVAGAHATSTRFARLDSAVLEVDLAAEYIGQTLYLKFVSFNIWGQGQQDIADPAEVATYQYVPSGIGTPPGQATLSLAAGINEDWGLASNPVSETDDWGLASALPTLVIDLGLASS